ncbi:MAG TPA: aldo/keto reductase, partial [Polyangiaceae bacterium]
VPRRTFGGSGISLSTLCLGGSSVVGADSRSLLEEALKYGIDCWEFNPFTGQVFGDYFKAHPGVRERIFLTGKSKSADPVVLQEDLDRTLVTNQTSVIDFFAIHGVDSVDVLTDDVRRWAEKAKREGKIRLFGFCTHRRVNSCLERAADLGWIDGIQAFYNFRLQADADTQAALRKCQANGIGIITVKSMALCVEDEAEVEALRIAKAQLLTQLACHRLSFEQAKLKAIWQNPHITSICSLMPNVSILRTNASAAMDDRPLPEKVTSLLADYADATGRYFCRRCGACDTKTPERLPIFNVMESLLYARGYRAMELARLIFAQIPADLRNRMLQTDYSNAESACPQRMPIGQLMRQAFGELNR